MHKSLNLYLFCLETKERGVGCGRARDLSQQFPYFLFQPFLPFKNGTYMILCFARQRGYVGLELLGRKIFQPKT